MYSCRVSKLCINSDKLRFSWKFSICWCTLTSLLIFITFLQNAITYLWSASDLTCQDYLRYVDYKIIMRSWIARFLFNVFTRLCQRKLFGNHCARARRQRVSLRQVVYYEEGEACRWTWLRRVASTRRARHASPFVSVLFLALNPPPSQNTLLSSRSLYPTSSATLPLSIIFRTGQKRRLSSLLHYRSSCPHPAHSHLMQSDW